MAELNFGLLTPPGSQSVGNAFVQGMDQAQESRARDLQMQRSMRQDQLSEMQLQKTQRDEAALSKFYAHIAENGGPSDPLEIENKMIGSGIQKVVDTGLAARMKRLGVEQERKRFVDANAPPTAPGVAAPMAPAPGSFGADVATRRAADMFAPPPERTNMMPGAAAAPAGVNSLAALNNQIAANMALGTEQGYKTAEILQKRADALSKRYTVGNTLMGSEGNIYGTAPTPSRLLTPDEEAQRLRIAGAGRAPAQPRPEQPPVAVVDATGRTVYVSREEALRNRMTPANAGEGLPPKEIQKREAALPAATSAVKGFETKSATFIKDLEKLRDHPGLSSITGIAAGRLPGLTSDGRAAQALYDKVVAKGGFQALQDLRDASKTGGALGNVSNQEGKQLTASFAAIDRRQDALNVQETINQAIADIQGARTRTREAYDSTYSYKNPAGRPAGGVVDFGSLR
jgi:hypothetical protein